MDRSFKRCSEASFASGKRSKINLSVQEEFCDTSVAENGNENCNDAETSNMPVIDQVWTIRDVETNNENKQVLLECPIFKSEIDESREGYEGTYSFANLNPDDPVPSSSGYQELFINSQQESFGSTTEHVEIEINSSSESDEPDDILVLNRSPDCDMVLQKLKPLENHSIMFHPCVRLGNAPYPLPKQYTDKWDSDHVRMPCSPSNRYPIENSLGETVIGSRWDLICQSLMTDIKSSEDIEKAIVKYNRQNFGKWNFEGLHSFINQHWSEALRKEFFDSTLQSMIEMALNLPNICTQPIPLLKKNQDRYITMSQKQIGCLLLNAFFCTFPKRNFRHKDMRNSEYALFPEINFNRLFYGKKGVIHHRNAEKLKCLFNYFKRITLEEPSGTVTFHRQVIPLRGLPKWHSSSCGIRTAVIKSHGLIENEGQGFLQVDFANKFVGGDVLGTGCVQEQIRFVICPELIVSRLFVESLENNEALIIIGAEKYNRCRNYSDTFKWEGDFKDNTPRDSWGRRCSKIVAIDATNFKNSSDQYSFQSLKRELNKAYCGFYENAPPSHLVAVATGNWGCGTFNASPELKFIIQLMAASQCGRSLLYFTFKNKQLKKELQDMYKFIKSKNLSVGDLWRLLIVYANKSNAYDSKDQISLYSFIYSQFTTMNTSSQQEKKSYIELIDSYKTAANWRDLIGRLVEVRQELVHKEVTENSQDRNLLLSGEEEARLYEDKLYQDFAS